MIGCLGVSCTSQLSDDIIQEDREPKRLKSVGRAKRIHVLHLGHGELQPRVFETVQRKRPVGCIGTSGFAGALFSSPEPVPSCASTQFFQNPTNPLESPGEPSACALAPRTETTEG